VGVGGGGGGHDGFQMRPPRNTSTGSPASSERYRGADSIWSATLGAVLTSCASRLGRPMSSSDPGPRMSGLGSTRVYRIGTDMARVWQTPGCRRAGWWPRPCAPLRRRAGPAFESLGMSRV
jgi:hypothetical protein